VGVVLSEGGFSTLTHLAHGELGQEFGGLVGHTHLKVGSLDDLETVQFGDGQSLERPLVMLSLAKGRERQAQLTFQTRPLLG
jgi:hypothetical protein